MKALLRHVRVAICGPLWIGIVTTSPAQDADMRILNVPDYTWYAGCFGTATGNLMGYWDRNGFPGFYTGPTAGGIAPLDSCGTNITIRSMWASKAGFDGRPANQPGHIDDYWSSYSVFGNCGEAFNYSYQDTGPDPYQSLGRPEHPADCVGDFIGLSQKKWTNMNGECDGNIDAYSFVYWDLTGNRRVNFATTNGGVYQPDIQSGLRDWTRYRGYEADAFTQLADFNPRTPTGRGFTFENLKAEINAGYPVLIFLQPYDQTFRNFPGMNRANPIIHGMLAFGYQEWSDLGLRYVYFRTSRGNGEYFANWDAGGWESGLPVRGFIGYRPKPKVQKVTRNGNEVTVIWDGPASQVRNLLTGATSSHRYQLWRTTSLNQINWKPIGVPTTERTTTVTESGTSAFYRIELLPPQ